MLKLRKKPAWSSDVTAGDRGTRAGAGFEMRVPRQEPSYRRHTKGDDSAGSGHP